MLKFSGNPDQPPSLSPQMEGASTLDLERNASISAGGISGMAF